MDAYSLGVAAYNICMSMYLKLITSFLFLQTQTAHTIRCTSMPCNAHNVLLISLWWICNLFTTPQLLLYLCFFHPSSSSRHPRLMFSITKWKSAIRAIFSKHPLPVSQTKGQFSLKLLNIFVPLKVLQLTWNCVDISWNAWSISNPSQSTHRNQYLLDGNICMHYIIWRVS